MAVVNISLPDQLKEYVDEPIDVTEEYIGQKRAELIKRVAESPRHAN